VFLLCCAGYFSASYKLPHTYFHLVKQLDKCDILGQYEYSMYNNQAKEADQTQSSSENIKHRETTPNKNRNKNNNKHRNPTMLNCGFWGSRVD